jgi:hypothetical protein
MTENPGQEQRRVPRNGSISIRRCTIQQGGHPRHRDDSVPDHNQLMRLDRILRPGMDLGLRSASGSDGRGRVPADSRPTGPARTYPCDAGLQVQGTGLSGDAGGEPGAP